MIVRSLTTITDTDRDVKTPHWRSKRIVLADDGAGFSLHETTLYAGTVNEFHYTHHVEAVWIVDGTGVLVDLERDVRHELAPGVLYLLDGHDRHQVRPTTDIRAVCVFNPALTGAEVHDADGAYPPPVPTTAS